jgi:hypothetical protein
MNTSIFIPSGDQWKDPKYVDKWRRSLVPLFSGVPLLERAERELAPAINEANQLVQWENENLIERAHRLEPRRGRVTAKQSAAGQINHQTPAVIAYAGGAWVVDPLANRATEGKLRKAKQMVIVGLEVKAQRELCCGLLGGEVQCANGHHFRASYMCGNRFCVTCGPKGANRLFAKHIKKLFFAAQRLMLCGVEECSECSKALANDSLPHWPPPRGARPRVVCAKIDFTLRHEVGDQMPEPERMRELNHFIKRFCRALEKKFGISRKQYGLAYCDELGGNNSNPHAHGVYVGPWLPQKQKELSALWQQITGDSFIVSIKYAEDFPKALFHAVKYPAKFAERSSPERLASLEYVFHRVRRFHALASFYNPDAPREEKPPARVCPECGSNLSCPRGFETLAELTRRGLEDIESAAVRIARERGLSGDPSPPP